MINKNVWVLNCGGKFPCGVFETKEQAEIAIHKYNLAGIITEYPLNQLAYDLAIEKGFLVMGKAEQSTPAFIGRFAYSQAQEHYHYENGERETATFKCVSNGCGVLIKIYSNSFAPLLAHVFDINMIELGCFELGETVPDTVESIIDHKSKLPVNIKNIVVDWVNAKNELGITHWHSMRIMWDCLNSK